MSLFTSFAGGLIPSDFQSTFAAGAASTAVDWNAMRLPSWENTAPDAPCA